MLMIRSRLPTRWKNASMAKYGPSSSMSNGTSVKNSLVATGRAVYRRTSMPAVAASACSIRMNIGASFSEGTIRFSVSSCSRSTASLASISAFLLTKGSSCAFSAFLRSSASRLALFCSVIPLKTRWYRPAVTSRASTSMMPSCCFSGSSVSFAINSPLLALLRLRRLSLADQCEHKRLDVFHHVVLVSFLDLHRAEIPGAAQVVHQPRHRVHAQRHAFQIDVVSVLVHLAQPDGVGLVHGVG